MRFSAATPRVDADVLAATYAFLGSVGGRAAGDASQVSLLPGAAEDRLALAMELSRFDPRLLGVVVDVIARSWRSFDPVALRAAIHRLPTPAVAGVVAGFAASLPGERDRSHFLAWLVDGLQPAPLQLYFIGIHAPGGRLVGLAAERPHVEYLRWGFLARERPFAKDAQIERRAGRYPAATRRRILLDLLGGGRSISLGDYLDAVERCVSRQQALADIRTIPDVVRKGHGRGTRYRLPS
jgi:hypothetical protein